MRKPQRAGLAVAVALLAVSASAQNKKEFSTSLTAGASVAIVNEYGSINVQPATNGKLLISALPHSSKVEVDFHDNAGGRVEARSHVLRNGSADETRVDYEVRLPAGVSVSIRSSNGPLTVDGINSDVTCAGESAPVQVRNGGNGHVHVRSVDGPITLASLKNVHMEVVSIVGDVAMTDVTGPSVTVNTTKGKITYAGDFSGGGDYSLSSHSGDIDVIMPAGASVDMSAKSVQGSVTDGFQLQPAAHPMFVVTQGKSFAGTANSGASSVKLRSFNGKIRVQKQ